MMLMSPVKMMVTRKRKQRLVADSYQAGCCQLSERRA